MALPKVEGRTRTGGDPLSAREGYRIPRSGVVVDTARRAYAEIVLQAYFTST